MKLNTIKMIIVPSVIINNIIQVYATNELRQPSSRAISRPCQPCILCKQGNLPKYFHPQTWKNRASIDQFREFEPALDIQLDSCICRRCIGNVETMSVSSQSGFIPRWRKKSSPHKHCCVPECVHPAQEVTKMVNHEQICAFSSMPDTDNLETNYVSG